MALRHEIGRALVMDDAKRFAEIFEHASRQQGYVIDEPFGCVHVALKPETWAKAAVVMRAVLQELEA